MGHQELRTCRPPQCPTISSTWRRQRLLRCTAEEILCGRIWPLVECLGHRDHRWATCQAGYHRVLDCTTVRRCWVRMGCRVVRWWVYRGRTVEAVQVGMPNELMLRAGVSEGRPVLRWRCGLVIALSGVTGNGQQQRCGSLSWRWSRAERIQVRKRGG